MAVLIKHLNEIKEHLEIVLSMEVYTGEPTIENLSKHMKDMVEFCEEYNKVFDFLDSKNEQNQEK